MPRRWECCDTACTHVRKAGAASGRRVFCAQLCHNRTEPVGVPAFDSDEQRQVEAIGSAITEPHQKLFAGKVNRRGKMRFIWRLRQWKQASRFCCWYQR